jgi:hypothetical protein
VKFLFLAGIAPHTMGADPAPRDSKSVMGIWYARLARLGSIGKERSLCA